MPAVAEEMTNSHSVLLSLAMHEAAVTMSGPSRCRGWMRSAGASDGGGGGGG